MISDIFQDIRQRNEYVSEVQRYVLDVLYSFQKDALKQGANISIDAADPNVTGGYLELVETGATQNSRVTVEVSSLGEMRILRAFSDHNSFDETQSYVTRVLDMEMPPISSATDVLLAIADDHTGFIGTSLGTFLEAQAFNARPPPDQDFEPL